MLKIHKSITTGWDFIVYLQKHYGKQINGFVHTFNNMGHEGYVILIPAVSGQLLPLIIWITTNVVTGSIKIKYAKESSNTIFSMPATKGYTVPKEDLEVAAQYIWGLLKDMGLDQVAAEDLKVSQSVAYKNQEYVITAINSDTETITLVLVPRNWLMTGKSNSFEQMQRLTVARDYRLKVL